jgi:crotonobetainyl-CoA:carnitine CoA-transferase CaiB-like acyl-CoA transferase
MSGLLDALSPSRPRVPGVQLVDASAALLAAVQILAAIHARESGPQLVDVSLLSGAQAMMPGAIAEAQNEVTDERSIFDELRGGPRNDVYRCADGAWIAVTPLEDAFWNRFCQGLRRDGYLGSHEEPTSGALQRIFSSRTCGVWCEWLRDEDVPAAPVHSVREALHLLRDPVRPPPALGQDSAAILRDLGYDSAEINELVTRGVVRTG